MCTVNKHTHCTVCACDAVSLSLPVFALSNIHKAVCAIQEKDDDAKSFPEHFQNFQDVSQGSRILLRPITDEDSEGFQFKCRSS